jgi:hypothetical protein
MAYMVAMRLARIVPARPVGSRRRDRRQRGGGDERDDGTR